MAFAYGKKRYSLERHANGDKWLKVHKSHSEYDEIILAQEALEKVERKKPQTRPGFGVSGTFTRALGEQK